MAGFFLPRHSFAGAKNGLEAGEITVTKRGLARDLHSVQAKTGVGLESVDITR